MAQLGNNIFVLIGEGAQAQIIAGTLGNELRTSSEKIPISSPKTGKWKKNVSGLKEWRLVTNFLYLNETSAWRTALQVGKSVHLQFVKRVAGSIVVEMEADAIIDECTTIAPIGNLAKGTFSFVGNGELYDIVPVTAITLSDAEMSINEGTSATIVATISPSDATNKHVTWQSSDEGIATVDNEGNVTAVSEGTCTVNCTSQADTSISASCSVEVLPPVAVESVSISPSTIEPYVGEIVKLTATVLPSDAADKRVTWSSSDNSVATVDDEGNVTAVGEGSCTITCTSVADNTKTATASITVSAFVPVESITLSGGDYVYMYLPGDGQLYPDHYEMHVTFTPSNASNKNLKFYYAEGYMSITPISDTVYMLKALRRGTILLTATSEDDMIESNEVYIVITKSE